MKLAYKPSRPMWNRYSRCENMFSIKNPLRIEIQAKCFPGTFVYNILPTYVTDFRSGPSIVNPFIPKIGDTKLALAWLIHDVNYHGFTSKKLADRLLLEMLKYAGLGTVKSHAVYYAVKFFAGSHYNRLDEDQGYIYNRNKGLVKFQWLDENGFSIKRFNGRRIICSSRR